MEATEKLKNLPPNFVLRRDVEIAFGVANLELNSYLNLDLVKPIKRIPLYSKLEKGKYETIGSKSDKLIFLLESTSIKFFKNNLASFVEYKTIDDISCVNHQHRPLVAEFFVYYVNKGKTSLATIKSRFYNTITRIFRIAYETKNYKLYVKYSNLVRF